MPFWMRHGIDREAGGLRTRKNGDVACREKVGDGGKRLGLSEYYPPIQAKLLHGTAQPLEVLGTRNGHHKKQFRIRFSRRDLRHGLEEQVQALKLILQQLKARDRL